MSDTAGASMGDALPEGQKVRLKSPRGGEVSTSGCADARSHGFPHRDRNAPYFGPYEMGRVAVNLLLSVTDRPRSRPERNRHDQEHADIVDYVGVTMPRFLDAAETN